MTGPVAFVASPGGHIDEAFEIADQYANRNERVFITAETMQTRALLGGEYTVWVPEVRSREAVRAVLSLGAARRVLRAERPRLVVSTGSALTVPYMVVARAKRIAVRYIESATRLTGPSVTGKIAERLPGVERFAQSADWGRPGWQPHRSVFDGYVSEQATERPVRSVLVTVGSEQFPFRRAIHAVRAATASTTQPVRVAWQTGHTPIAGGELLGEVRAWWPVNELVARAAAVDVIVTHAGVGSILMALRSGKCPVVLARKKELGEHVDDHQSELVARLEREGLVVSVRPGEDLSPAIFRATARRVVKRA